MRQCFCNKCFTVFCATRFFCLAVFRLLTVGSKIFGSFGSDNVKFPIGENVGLLVLGRGPIGVGVERSEYILLKQSSADLPGTWKELVSKITELINDKGRYPHIKEEICRIRNRTYHWNIPVKYEKEKQNGTMKPQAILIVWSSPLVPKFLHLCNYFF